MNGNENSYLGVEPIGSLMRKYAIPCIISLLVGALYNIVDQIFIANASYGDVKKPSIPVEKEEYA